MTNGERFKDIFGLYATEVWAMSEKDFLKWISTLTTAAEPVKHGHWIEEGLVDGNQNRYCRCSECGKGDTQAISQKVPYCWWCGARMDEVEE